MNEPTRSTEQLGSRWRSTRATVVRAFALLPLAVVLAVVLAGCGGSNEAATTTGETTTFGKAGTTLELAADPNGQLRYDKTSLEAPAGDVTIVLTNDSSVEHDVAIKGNGVDAKSDLASNGETTTVSANLASGTYTFYCTVPGHEAAGMEGTLTVG
jgi:plastocyanin